MDEKGDKWVYYSQVWLICVNFQSWKVLELLFAAGLDVNRWLLDVEGDESERFIWTHYSEVWRLLAVYGSLPLYRLGDWQTRPWIDLMHVMQ